MKGSLLHLSLAPMDRSLLANWDLKCDCINWMIIGAFACSAFSRSKWILVAKSAKLLKSATKSIFHSRSRSATESTQTEFRDRK